MVSCLLNLLFVFVIVSFIGFVGLFFNEIWIVEYGFFLLDKEFNKIFLIENWFWIVFCVFVVNDKFVISKIMFYKMLCFIY